MSQKIPLTTLEIFDPATNTWSAWKKPRATPGMGACLVVGGDNNIYMAGGNASTKYVDRYTPYNDTWTNIANMPGTFHDAGCTTLPTNPLLVSFAYFFQIL